MKISELIEKLKDAQNDVGDTDVVIIEPGTDDCVIDIYGISFLLSDDEEPIHALVCDEETYEAFRD